MRICFRLTLSLYMALIPFFSLAHAEVSLVNRYDANGNLLGGDGKYYEYNEANQLAKVRENDKDGKVIAQYFYDHTGQRVKKIENGVTTYYIGKYFESTVTAGKTEDTTYFFADGERVAKKDSTGTYFYHPDHLGGTNVVTNVAGTVVARNAYLPFGEMREGGAEKFSYTGKEKDKSTDLYYYDSRYNNPDLRHFIQADSADPDIDDPQDLNRYAYVGNNPLSYIDPDGHKKKKAKLSKREKWMIAHGVDPDKDKTSLRKAKKQLKAGEKYAEPPKSASSNASSHGNSTHAASVTGKSNSNWTKYPGDFGKELGKEYIGDLSEQTLKGVIWAIKHGYKDGPAIKGSIIGSIKAELSGRRILKSTFAPAIGNFLAGIALDKLEPSSKKVPWLGELPGVGDILFRYTPITPETIEENGDVYINGVFQGNCNCK